MTTSCSLLGVVHPCGSRPNSSSRLDLLATHHPAKASNQLTLWKPRSHGATANIALYDAADAHICLPGISQAQVYIGGDLTGYYSENGEWRAYNDIVSLAAYFRAGANGPDAFPDAVTGQLLSHVDYSRKAPAIVPDDFWADAVGEEVNAALDWIVDTDALRKLPMPISNASTPLWRSSDWGDEVLSQALAFHRDELAGHTRAEALAHPRLAMLYKERQASIAFALGYLMHLSGDSFAHSFVNEHTKSPFDMWSGRQHDDGSPYYTDGMVHAIEELKHIALEKYANERFIPDVVGDGCEAVDPEWTTDVSSVCDGAEPGEFELSCDYCNPLRGLPGPPEVALSDTCDRCFAGCNPWREVCPPRAPEGLPCTECPRRASDLADCAGDSECIEAVELACSNSALKCCDTYAQELVNLGIINSGEADDYVCPASNEDGLSPSSWDIIQGERESYSIDRTPFAPEGCYQGELGRDFDLPEPLEIEVEGQLIEVGVNDFGFTVDLNGDGEPDLINECMLWNCFLSPGTEFCSLRALTNELPSRDLGGSLVCDDVSVDVLERDPDALLLDTDVSIPRNFYRKMWLERRYPEGETVGSLGTYSLGGIVPNGIYVVSDSLKYFENLMRNLRNPVEYFVAKCTGNWDSPECEMSRKVGTFYAILAGAIVVLYGVGALLALIPFAGPFLAAPFLFAASFISTTLLLFRDHMLPGITLPIAGMREKLKRHLDENWVDHVMVTSQRMAGESCANTCGEFAEEDSSCVEHRLLGISGYLDWAEEAFDIVDSLDCSDNNYFKRILSGDMNVEDWYDIAISGGTIVATQQMSCLVADYFYENHFRDRTIGKLAGLIREHTTEQICGFVNFYEPLADENGIDISESACKQTLETLFPGSGASDDRELLVRIKDLIGVLDVGLTEDQRQTLYAQLNSLLARTAGIQVDFDRLRQLQIALDCSVGLDIDYGDIITTFNAREVLLNALDSFTDDGDPDTLTSGEEAVDSVDRAFGYYDEQQDAIDAVNQNLANSAFAPIDVNRFSPMYNTIALNKLILLGSGSDRCETLERECQGDNPPPGCGDCGSDDAGTATKEFPDSGIFDLVKKANRTRFSEAYDAAYSTEQLDENPATYLQSFFQEQFVEQGSWRGCERTGFNIACGAVYSIDDPKDYCQSLDSWDPDYLKKKYDFRGELEELEVGISKEDSGQYRVSDCAFAISEIDTVEFRELREEYAPNPRFRVGPAEDPRTISYNQPISSDDYLSVDNHRSTVLDRVIRQTVPERTSFRDLLNWLETAPVRIWAFAGSWFGTSEESTPSEPETESDYFPHALTRFSIANKDTHVSRLYSKLFAPFYCAEAHGSDQKDSDCDSVPDACDNCPFTYNPDQLDSNLDSIGDDCIGFDPFTFPLTPTPSSKVDIRCEDSGRPDLEVARPELRDFYTSAKN